MRVLLAVAHLDKGGGQAVQTSRLLRRLGREVDGELLLLAADGSRPSSLPLPNSHIVGDLRFPSGLLALRKAIAERARDFDLTHVFDPYYALPAARLARARPLVIRLGAHPVEDLASRYGRLGRVAMQLVNPWLYDSTTIVVNAAHLRSAFPRRQVECIANGIDVAEFADPPDRSSARAELRLPLEGTIATYTGKIIPRKHVDDLYALARAFPGLHVVLLGTDQEPYYGDRYHRQVREAFVDVLDRIHLPGEVPPEKVRRYLEASDLFVFPSRLEGMPNSVLEAMAAGLPVVAFDIPAHRELLAPGSGFLYRTREELTETVDRLIRDPNLQRSVGRAARARVARQFSIDAAARAYHRLYRRLTGEVEPSADPSDPVS